MEPKFKYPDQVRHLVTGKVGIVLTGAFEVEGEVTVYWGQPQPWWEDEDEPFDIGSRIVMDPKQDDNWDSVPGELLNFVVEPERNS